MSAYIADLQNLLDLGVTWAIGLVLLLAGSAGVGRRLPPEIRIVAGWGAFSLLMTAWGVLVPLSLAIPAVLFVLAAVAAGAWRGWPDRAEWTALGRMAAVSLPFWLVMAPVRPAEPDTWLNLLPNAVYLVDHGLLPAASRPPSHSFLPAAPYNTQFLAYLGGLVEPDFPAAGMSLVNLLLLLVSGGLIARVLSGRANAVPSWPATALGLLVATGLNPGFVPRIHLAAYGETGLAATALAASWLFVEARGGERSRSVLIAGAGLVLAAMVEVKQSGFGLVGACAAAAVTAAALERGALRALAFAAAAVLPAAAVFLLWRVHVAVAGVDELRPLAFADWQWANLPAILGSMGRTAVAKPVYFAAVALAIAALPAIRRRSGWNWAARFLAFHAALEGWYLLFLLLTYIGHFPGAWSTEAHSFFRYETHLSLVLALALALAVRELGLVEHLSERQQSLARRGTVALAAAAPVVFAPLLRFDLAMPQPLVWRLAANLVPYLHDGDRLALLLPGDNGSVATMLAGILNDTAPARKDLDLLVRDRADLGALDEAARQGYTLAFISCTPDRLAAFPPHAAVLARYADGTWRTVADWPYPPGADRSRWQHILSWQPLCRAEGERGR